MRLNLKKRVKHKLPDCEVNVTPLMDILTTLLFFIMMVMSMHRFSIIESTSLTAGEPSENPEPTFTMQITVQSMKELDVWIGPTEGLDKKINGPSEFYRFISKRFKGNPKQGYSLNIKANNKVDLFTKLQDHLIEIKKSFPFENKAVVSFKDEIRFQDVIDTLGSVRELSASSDGFVITGIGMDKEMNKVLFPQVIIGEEG